MSVNRPLCLIVKNASPLFVKEVETCFRLIDWAQLTEQKSHLKKEVVGAFLIRAQYPSEWRLEELPNLRVITNNGVGVNHIDFNQVAARGIKVSNTPDVIASSTADLAFGLIIALSRRFKELCLSVPFGSYMKSDAMFGSDISGATVGIVGLGAIGSEVARRATGFRMNILYNQRRRSETKEAEFGAKYCAKLDDLLSESDFVVLSCTLSDASKHLIGQNQLKQMKPSSYLINVSRGGVVDTEALVAALNARQIGGAGLDVTDPEPLPAGHPLYGRDNVFITPHIGTQTWQTRLKMARVNKEEMLRGLRGEVMKHELTIGGLD